MTTVHSAGQNPGRWGMLAVISLGIIALTLNWFDVAAAFPLIGAEFKVGLGPLSYLISLYIVGYGLTHIPGGMLATAIGMKKTLVLGLLVQGLAGIMSGLSHSYAELAFFRIASGTGGSVFIAVGTAAVVVWFRDKDVTLAPGITGGAVFSAGAAFALYGWLYVQRATSWRTSLSLAGVFELLRRRLGLSRHHVVQLCPCRAGRAQPGSRCGPWRVRITGTALEAPHHDHPPDDRPGAQPIFQAGALTRPASRSSLAERLAPDARESPQRSHPRIGSGSPPAPPERRRSAGPQLRRGSARHWTVRR